MKAVILAGGSGTRLYPLTRITNKHLLPIYDRPMISYAIEAMVKVGLTEIMLVTGGTHAGEFFRLVGNGHDFGVERMLYAYQENPGGIGDALGLARRFVDGDKVVVMLADNIFERSLKSAVQAYQQQNGGSRVVLARLEDERHLCSLGVVRLEGERIVEVIEKPSSPPSNLAVTGVYFYDQTVWEVLETLKPSGRGELEITDVNNHYIKEGLMEHQVLDGFWGDGGESINDYYRVNDFVRAHGANKD
ncbi:MAG: sugar phosphate nucleotidyltransferase [Candidatus Dormibacteraceae bacterium]